MKFDPMAPTNCRSQAILNNIQDNTPPRISRISRLTDIVVEGIGLLLLGLLFGYALAHAI